MLKSLYHLKIHTNIFFFIHLYHFIFTMKIFIYSNNLLCILMRRFKLYYFLILYSVYIFIIFILCISIKNAFLLL